MAYIAEVNNRFQKAIDVDAQKKQAVLEKESKNVGMGLVGAPACGDVMKVSVKIENGVIVDTSYKIFGCGAAIASASFASDVIKNKTIEDAMLITNEEIAKALSLPPIKRHCSLLAEQAIKAAIADYKSKNEGQ